MMYKEMAFMIYGYIMKAEMVFLRFYKTNPFEIMASLTLNDLNAYINLIQKEEEKEHNKIKNAKIMECLKSINDYLNVMFLKK